MAGRSPLIAVVRRRKDDRWVLPRGKLRPKESALAAALREAGRETGHSVAAREFLGTISCESGGKPKITQFWLMASRGRAGGGTASDAKTGNKTVKWLPLNAAIATLTEPLEQSFLAEVGKQRRDKFRKSMNGRQAAPLRAHARTGQAARDDRVKTAVKPAGRNPDAPGFIRSFFRRLKNPRQVSGRGPAFAG